MPRYNRRAALGISRTVQKQERRLMHPFRAIVAADSLPGFA
jgi:hypothetical protein